jgi:serine/threonine protein kinase
MDESQDIYTSEADFKKRYAYSPSDLLGEGGFAQVYKGFDKQFQEHVALKFYNKGEKGKYDVLHEMKDSRSFSHKNIIRVHDAFVVKFELAGTVNYVQVGVLEFANGGNLRDFVETKPTESRFIEVLVGILEGLEYLHREKNIIHRDLSPENILMFIEGERWIPKIADFGISKKLDSSSISSQQKKSTQLLGKYDYMAPEQFYPDKFGIKGNINTQVDLWAFGIILYELFMKSTPFSSGPNNNPMAAIQAISTDPIPDLNDIPDPYRTVIKKCLVKEVSKRVSNAHELITILENKKTVSKTEPVPTTPINNYFEKYQKSFKWVWISLGLLVLIVSGFFVFTRLLNPKPENILSEIKDLMVVENYTEALDKLNSLPEKTRQLPEFSTLISDCKIEMFKDDVSKLINRKQIREAMMLFNKMPENFKSDPEINNLYIQSSIAYSADSLRILINEQRLSAARSYYSNLDVQIKRSSELVKINKELALLTAIDSLLKDGNKIFNLRKYDLAKNTFNKVLQLDPDNREAHSMINEIDNLKPLPGPIIPTNISDCISEYKGAQLKIRQKPPESSYIKILSICFTNNEMRIKLELQPSDSNIRIYSPGSVNAFYIEYSNKTGQIPLLSVKGIATNSEVKLSRATQVDLIFKRLPLNVMTFNLLEGKNQIDENQTYWNFIGIELLN